MVQIWRYSTIMRIIRNTPDQLIVRDRALFPMLAVLCIALTFALLGTGAAVQGDDAATRLGGMAFAVVSVPLVMLAVYIAREHVHVFDRRRGVLLRRVRSLIGPREERLIPLTQVRGVELKIEREIADPDTYGIELLIDHDHGGEPERLPLRSYTSSHDLTPMHRALERWLTGAP